jgi:hypothetical protein
MGHIAHTTVVSGIFTYVGGSESLSQRTKSFDVVDSLE